MARASVRSALDSEYVSKLVDALVEAKLKQKKGEVKWKESPMTFLSEA